MQDYNGPTTEILDLPEELLEQWDHDELHADEYHSLAERYRGMTEEEAFYHQLVDARMGIWD